MDFRIPIGSRSVSYLLSLWEGIEVRVREVKLNPHPALSQRARVKDWESNKSRRQNHQVILDLGLGEKTHESILFEASFGFCL